MVPIFEDSVFYGLAAEMTELYQAISRESSPTTAGALLRLFDSVDGNISRAEDIPPDPILLDLERLMIQEFFNLPYLYQTLDQPDAIRLLILHPGSPCEPLRGMIQHTNIPERGYEAISYSWGTDAKPCSILLDGFQMSLTQSLYNALIRLRYPNKDRKLWADSLCINQADKKEKGIQVALMPKIYTYARKVLVHLGMEADGSELLPELLQQLEKVDFARFQKRKILQKDFHLYGLPLPEDGVWKVVIDFLCRPWFLRIWVIQEIVLARDVCFFCGGWEMRWGLLSNLGNIFDSIISSTPHGIWSNNLFKAQHAAMSLALMLALRLTRSVVAERMDLLKRDIDSVPRHTSDTKYLEGLDLDLVAKRDFIIRSCQEHRELYPILERTIYAVDGVKSSPTPILKLLWLFKRNEATKPQDRLYALVGLAGDINLEEFPPNYEETVYQTDARFARKLVEKGQGMDLLFHATNLSGEVRNLALPSWAPDWSLCRSMYMDCLKLGWAYKQYSGDSKERDTLKSSISLVDGAPNIIKISGFRVDGLKSVVKLVDNVRDFKISNFDTASKKYFQRVEAVMNDDPYITGEPWPEVLCRTLIADHLDMNGISVSDATKQYEEGKKKIMQPPQDHKEKSMNSWSSAWFHLLPEFAFCITTKGYVGLVPQATSATDEVFMFQGSDLPFVLRPIHAIPGFYRFVGGCYIHGLMNGEAWKLEHTRSEVFLF